VRTGVVILPDLRWPDAVTRWREAEDSGFATAWTYDHLSWRSLRDEPWLGAVPLLAAVAASTSTLRIGTLVTSPNFRHPALLAKDVMTLDEISGGRIDLGVGSGGTGYDASVLGAVPPGPRERTERFIEFVDALDLLLREPSTSFAGQFFTAVESRTWPGCVQQPRVPFTVAAAGPRGMQVVARHGHAWVTFGPVDPAATPHQWWEAIRTQSAMLDSACDAAGRDRGTVARAALLGLELGWAQESVDAYDDVCGRLTDAGFTDVVVHWPRPHDTNLPGPAPHVFDEIRRRAAPASG
jgi:alkanesulfonate monooxygenase SsuD/methylene tetrahydromethanopterin reductase-like flavin-dependent oxidoreductase (luciferase family)